jgi:hypothetical protein
MNFQLIRDSVITLLGDAEAGRYRTIGYQERSQGATEVLDNNKTVQVFYSGGEFPKSAASLTGPYQHEPTFELVLTASKATSVDLAVLENPASTEGEKAAALAARQEAVFLVDRSLDNLFDDVYNEIMDARSLDLGMPSPIGSRHVPRYDKGQPQQYGQYVILTGSMQVTCKIDERAAGLEGTAGTTMDVTLEVHQPGSSAADEAKAGVLVEEE